MENQSLDEIYAEYVQTYNSITEEMKSYVIRHQNKKLFSKMFIDTFNHQISDFSNSVSNNALFSQFINYSKEELELFRIKILQLANDLHANSQKLAKGKL